jgi:hypothetical protein
MEQHMKITNQKLKQIIKEELAEMQTQQEAQWVDDMFGPRNKIEALQMGLDDVLARLQDLQSSLEQKSITEDGIKKVLLKIVMSAKTALDKANKLQ